MKLNWPTLSRALSEHGEHKRPRLRAGAVALVSMSVLTFFATTSGASGITTTPKVVSHSSLSKAAVKVLTADINGASSLRTKFAVPGPGIKASSLKGKTVFYIPLTLAIPEFAALGDALDAAFAKLGVHVVSCSGDTNPSTVNSCINEAIAEKAAGVFTFTIPPQLDAAGFASLQSHHIPVEIGAELPPTASQGNDALSYQSDGLSVYSLAADWIILNSKGNANILADEQNDSSSQVYYMQLALNQFTKYCPKTCHVTLLKTPSADVSTISSDVSAALASHTDINYAFVQYDDVLPNIMAGIQSAGDSSKIKIASTTSLLSALQLMKQGKSEYADAGSSLPYNGFAYADQLVRMILNKPILSRYAIPVRVFTRSNVGSVALTTAASDDGSWFSTFGYVAMFTKLWGVNTK